MKIKRLTPADYDVLVNLWVKAGLSFRPEGRDSKPALQTQIKETPDLFLGAFLEDELIGCVIASCDGRKGWINRLAVLPDYRRQGIAQALLQAAETALKRRGVDVVGALIFEANVSSLNLFQKMGYTSHEDIRYVSKRKSEDS